MTSTPTTSVVTDPGGPSRARTARPRRSRAHRATAWLAGATCLALTTGWLGLRVQPAQLPPSLGAAPPGVASLPEDLPAPVERFYRVLYGDTLPVIDTVVVSGRGSMRVAGITFPSRYRFSHITGRAYRHYIETTVFGVPFLSVDEWFVDGTARIELPFGVSEGPQVDQGANLALWAELVWAPAVWATDPEVRWEPIDATTARLVVPFRQVTEAFTVTFDQATGLLERMESQRYKDQNATAKTPWICEVREWGQLDGRTVARASAVRWGDEGAPWAELRTEAVLYDADLSTYLRAEGP